jgi:hypothetical protein
VAAIEKRQDTSDTIMVTALNLLRRGYFPRELPPVFTTELFGTFISASGTSLTVPKEWTKCASHNLLRPGSLRRPLKIPNPMHQWTLCNLIEQYWNPISTRFKLGSLSVSRPLVRRTILDRAVVPRLAFGNIPRIRARRFVGTRYFLRTDINQFYSSIYTHSIPWALHGKVYSKANKGKTDGDKIDKAIRDLQDGQTIGIPIGPDTSLIIAETLLAAVDENLRNPIGFRYVDDYELGYGTLGEAERGLTELQGQLSNYELTLNPRKTNIIEGPFGMEVEWAVELGQFPFRTGSAITKVNDAVAFFSRAFDFAKRHPTQSVLKYAIVKAQQCTFDGDGWTTFQALLYSAITFDPGAIPVAIVLVDRHEKAGRKVNKTALGKAIESIISRHAPLGHGSEVAWALWAAIQFKITLSVGVSKLLSSMEDDVVALLSLDAKDRKLIKQNGLDLTKWAATVGLPDALVDEHWLLSYEANRKRWLRCPAVGSHPFFKNLEQSNISFYDPARSLGTFIGAAAPLPGGSLGSKYF